ncbi:hypothetical protein EZS27_043076, partial [termite gut metagenome]
MQIKFKLWEKGAFKTHTSNYTLRGIDLCIRIEKEKAYLHNPSQSCSMLIQMNLSEEEIRLL